MPNRYSILMCDASTGILLNQAGKYHLKGQPEYAPTFTSEDAALRAKDDLLALFPWAEVVISDCESANSPRRFCASDDRRARCALLHRLYTAYLTTFPLRRCFMKRPLDPWDPNSYYEPTVTGSSL